MSDTDTGQWRRAAELFDDLIDLSPEARAERLEAACASDAELRVAVGRLFAAHERAVGETGAGERLVAGAVRAWAEDGDLPEGTQIGPFRCVRALGSGGMGQVYLAERDIDGRTQQVALKLPRVRMGSEFLTRFRRERAILVQLQHPAIARLIDAGELADQRPYLAMEYVLGQPIDAYCRAATLSIPARLRLVRKVLDALQHAHERLVLHRDIKPANILVDAGGDPRVLDFGIGKQLEDESPQLTADGQRYFSLASAAPEQIRGEPSSAATDVYAVGVLLYELLSGVPPLAFNGLDPHAALQRALEQVPPLASVAVGQLSAAERSRLAAERGLRDGAWVGALRGDLDQILARALRKEPGQRYATAAAFAADLDAVLELRPIAARQSERWYRLNRFIRRHLVAMTSISALVLAIGVFVTLTIWQSAQVRTARDQSEQVTEFLKNLFRQVDPTVARGRELTARELLDRGVDEVRGGLVNQPEVKAAVMGALADIQLSLGNTDGALELASEAQQLSGGDQEQRERAHVRMARILLARADPNGAIAEIDQVSKAETISADLSDRGLYLLTLRTIALGYLQMAPRESVARWRDIASETERRFGPTDLRTVDVRRRLAFALGAAGDVEAQGTMLDALSQRVALSGADDDLAMADSAYRAAISARDSDAFDRARALARYALQVHTKVYGTKHPKVVSAMNLLATIDHRNGRIDAARKAYEDLLPMVDAAFEPAHPARAMVRISLGSLLLHDARDAQASLPYLEAAVAHLQQHLPGQINLMLARTHLAQALVDLERISEAADQFDAALSLALAQKQALPATVASLQAQRLCLAASSRRPADWRAVVKSAQQALEASDASDPAVRRLADCLAQ